jgi:two-component system cell cycle sensor histidine kinase/response regulator CckA
MPSIADSRQDPTAAVPIALVIDDEPIIRQLIHRTLEPATCRVVEARSGDEGLRIIQRAMPPIDVVLTDLTMPDLGGWEVAQVLARYRPAIQVGVVSGCAETIPDEIHELGARLLIKPFTSAALVALMKQLIVDARAAARRQGADEAAAVSLVEAARALRRRPVE